MSPSFCRYLHMTYTKENLDRCSVLYCRALISKRFVETLGICGLYLVIYLGHKFVKEFSQRFMTVLVKFHIETRFFIELHGNSKLSMISCPPSSAGYRPTSTYTYILFHTCL